jgi:Spa2 homology domain (SHD) of GIT
VSSILPGTIKMSFELNVELISPHFQLFGSFLEPITAKQNDSAKGSWANTDKLGKLSNNQFFELSTDVYDELKRRQSESETFLSVRVRDIRYVRLTQINNNYHPKRNQARQKLATLSSSRFKELVGDVYFEAVRRFPSLQQSEQISRQESTASSHSVQKKRNKKVSLDNLMMQISNISPEVLWVDVRMNEMDPTTN